MIKTEKTKISKALAFDPANFGKRFDLSPVINVMPNYWYLTDALGLFRERGATQKTTLIPVFEEQANILIDRNWDERNSNIRRPVKKYLTVSIPHFPADDAIMPHDVDGIGAWDQVYSGLDLETIAAVRERKMDAIRRAIAHTKEVARMHLITTGSIYAPEGTLTQNFYTEFGVTRTELPVDFTGLTNPQKQLEEIVAALQDNLHTGAVVSDFVAFCSPDYFNALLNNAQLVDTLKYKVAAGDNQSILLERATTNNARLDARYRSFDFYGITFYEVRGTEPISGDPLIPAGDAYFFPVGVPGDLFETVYAPPNRLSTVNTVGLPAYFWEFRNEKDDIIEIMSETNFVNVLKYPQEVIRSYLDTTP